MKQAHSGASLEVAEGLHKSFQPQAYSTEMANKGPSCDPDAFPPVPLCAIPPSLYSHSWALPMSWSGTAPSSPPPNPALPSSSPLGLPACRNLRVDGRDLVLLADTCKESQVSKSINVQSVYYQWSIPMEENKPS